MKPVVRYHPLVAHCVSGTPARVAVVEVLDRARFRSLSVSADRPARELRRPTPPDALVYDLAPFDGDAYQFVRDVKKEMTALPVLLYPPPRPRVGELLALCTRLPFVSAEIQDPTAPLGPAFRQALVKTLATGPAARVLEIMRNCLPFRPPIVTEFLRAVMFGLRSGTFRGPPRLGQIARRLDTTRRTLERQWRWNALPSPKELADWAMILLVMRMAADLGIRPSAAARACGLNAQQLYRLRRRLPLFEKRDDSAEGEFNLTATAFAGRCKRRLPASRIYDPQVAM